MMDWQRDPKTGEWVAIDPMTQSTSQAEPDPSLRDPVPPYVDAGPSGSEAGYDTGDDGVYPVQSPQMAPRYTAEGLPIYHGESMGPNRGDYGAGYQNYDPNAYAEWARGVEERGNEIRETAVGCFEVDSGNRIISKAPSGYTVN